MDPKRKTSAVRLQSALWAGTSATILLALAGCGLAGYRGVESRTSSLGPSPWADSAPDMSYLSPPKTEDPNAKKTGAGTGRPAASPDIGALPLVEDRPAYPGDVPNVDAAGVRQFDPVFFDRDSPDLDAAAKQRLREDAEWLAANPSVLVTLGGYVDLAQTQKFGLNLSMARALTVQEFLIGMGIDPGRLYPVGYGEAPEADTRNADENQMRRVELLGSYPPAGATGETSAARVPASGDPAPPVGAPASLPVDRDLL